MKRIYFDENIHLMDSWEIKQLSFVDSSSNFLIQLNEIHAFIYFIYFGTLSGDVLLSKGLHRKNTVAGGTLGNDTVKKFAETTVSITDILEDDGQITLPLTDEANQSSMKKVSDTISTHV